MLIAQLSDTHIRRPGETSFGKLNTAACLRRAVATVNALEMRPDFVVLSGDLVDNGYRDEYLHLKKILSDLKPIYYLMYGNHDARETLAEAFPEQIANSAPAPFLQRAIEGEDSRAILLDTLMPGEAHGALDDARLGWLDHALAARPDQPTIVFMHHPPFDTGVADMDAIKCRNSAALAQLLAKHPQVQRIACGHVHRHIQTLWAGIACCVAPSTAHQLALDLRGDAREAQFMLEPPGFLLHSWRPETGLVTHYCVTGDYPGPFTFSGNH